MIFNIFTFVYVEFSFMAIGAGAIFLSGPLLMERFEKTATYRFRDSAAAGLKQSRSPLEQLRSPNGGSRPLAPRDSIPWRR